MTYNPAFQRGDQLPVSFQALGQGNVAVLAITGYTLDVSVLLFDVTNTSTGGNTARLAGKRDASGTINYDFDANSPTYLTPPNLVEGVSGVMLFFVKPNNPIQVPIIIEKMHLESSVTSELKGSCDVKMNALAGQFVYPTT